MNTFNDICQNVLSDGWENIGINNTVINTLYGPLEGTIVLNWAHREGEIIATDSYDVSLDIDESESKYFVARSSLLSISGSFVNSDANSRIVTSYKETPTNISIVDGTSLNNNKLPVKLASSDGAIIDTTIETSETSLNAIFTSLKDIESINQTLLVSPFDSSNSSLSTSGINQVTKIEDPTFFPDTDIVIAVDRSYSMYLNDIDSTARYRIVFNKILPTIINYIKDNNGFSVANRTNVTIFTYARPEVGDISLVDLNLSIEHDSDRHAEIIQETGTDIDVSPYRTIIPGAIEINTSNYDDIIEIITDVSNILLHKNSTVYPGNLILDPLNGNTVMQNHHDLTPDLDYISETAYSGNINYPAVAPLHPATALYATINRVFQTQNYNASGAGNKSRWIEMLTEGLSDNPVSSKTYNQTDISIIELPDTQRKKVFINICDGGITDDFYEDTATGNGLYTYLSTEVSLAETINYTAHKKLEEIFGNNIYVFNLRNSTSSTSEDDIVKRKTMRLISARDGYYYQDPVTFQEISLNSTQLNSLTSEQLSQYFNNDHRIFDFSYEEDRSSATLTANLDIMLDNIFDHQLFKGHHAIDTINANSLGFLQAGTAPITGSYFSGNGLYYSLVDGYGNIINSVKTPGDNSLKVHLTDGSGSSIRHGNELQIKYSERVESDNIPFQMEISSGLTSIPELTNVSSKIYRLGVSNTTNTLMWVKVYDISSTTNVMDDISNNIIFNIPVQGNDYREINLGSGIAIEDGLYFRFSSDYKLNDNIVDYGNSIILIDGNYTITGV
jgi:hypothetical protein